MDINNVTLDIKLIDTKFKITDTYTTSKYDTWDLISLRFYEDEKYMDSLIYANRELNIDGFIDCDIQIKIPELKKIIQAHYRHGGDRLD